MKIVKYLFVIAAIGTVVGCSRDDREEIVERGGNAWNALKGESASGEKTPRIVKEQQRKERIRQNSTWTPENRAHHPIEYCQAQLEDLQRYARELEARAHEKSCAIAAVKRTLSDDDTLTQNLQKFLAEAKPAFKACMESNSWPIKLGGYTFSREKAQAKTASKKNQLVALEKTLKITQNEQKKVVALRERIQNNINDLRIKKVIDGDNGIVASLNEIEDNMAALGVNYDDPKIESIIQPDEKTTREELFKKIMAE